ncbi:Major facilitator superfamily domain-containing protein 6 [Sarcoptes scabiei]|nr:Major facilitator superfamily domain-containing protein 6 [Sarcoptes scabiei]
MLSIAFLHPDLGIGGAERLIIDCAIALKDSGHLVSIFTSHHDLNHCFEETKDGRINVVVAGDWLPNSSFGHFKAFWAYLRMIYLTFFMVLNYRFDCIICDQVPSGIPIIKASKQKCLFYCHYPDQLLAKHDSLLKKIYRRPIDWFEEWTINFADQVLVNSHFTQQVFRKTFKRFGSKIITEVLYPCVKFHSSHSEIDKNDDKDDEYLSYFLSINRFERKKNLELAIEAMEVLQNKLDQKSSKKSIHLVIAGGYDLNNIENIDYYEELIEKVKRSNLKDKVTFVRNLTDDQKQSLLKRCIAVIYTPENEHFGIVPLEAMYMKRPVIAANSGGPKETIIDEATGFLCQTTPVSFAEAMMKFVEDESLSNTMGTKAFVHVVNKFNYKNFKNDLNKIISKLVQ